MDATSQRVSTMHAYESVFCTWMCPMNWNSLRGSTLFDPNAQKSYKNYLQNTPHMVLHNSPTLSI